MSKARQIAENLGISLQPSQTGSVPTPPPRGGSMVEEPDIDVTTPRTINLSGRYRKQKALAGIKRKFESRYGEIIDEQRPTEYWGEQPLVARSNVISSLRSEREKRDAEERRRRLEKFKQERLPSQYQTPAGPQPETPVERSRRERQEQRSAELERQRQAYVMSQAISDPKDISGDRGRGLFGLGKQKEADKIGKALMHGTLFRSVRIKPFGSGVRVEVNATSHDGGEISIYLQKRFKVVLFNKVVAGTNRNEIQKAISAIVAATPQDWSFAADPRMVQKVLADVDRADPKSRGAVHGAHTLRKMLGNIDSKRIADRSIFLRVKRDHAGRDEPEVDDDAPIWTRKDRTTEPVRGPGIGDPSIGRRRSPVGDPSRGPQYMDPANIEWQAQQAAQAAWGGAFGGNFNDFDPMDVARASRYAHRDPSAGLADPDPFTTPDYSQPGMDFDDYPTMGREGTLKPSLDDISGKPSEPIRRSELRQKAQQDVDWDTAQFPPGPVPLGGGGYGTSREEPAIGYTGRHDRTRSDMGTPPFEDPYAGTPRHGRGSFDPEERSPYQASDRLLDAARTHKGQFDVNAPIVQYIGEKMNRNGFGVPAVRDLGKRGIVLATRELDIILRRQGSKTNLRTVILEVPRFEISTWQKVFGSLPAIVWPPRASASLTGFKLNHRVDLKSMVSFIEGTNPALLIHMKDALDPWITKMGQRGISVGTLNSKVKKLKERPKSRKPQGESVASVILDALSPVHEQSWYKEHVALAKKIQMWILRHLGGYQVSCAEIHDKFDSEHEEEAVDKAIEILRSNAAMYPMTGTNTSGRDCIYMINMTRLSSALL